MGTKDSFIRLFFKLESASGLVLFGFAVLAIVVANSPLAAYYQLLLGTQVEIHMGSLVIAKPLLLWINDGLMAIFFFLVGLELKRELLEGELSSVENILLPAIGAVGGMLFPALIYAYFNHDDPVAIAGWAIPAATDIAFALGVLSLLGSRVPTSLKIFLTSLAIFDDIGAIVIIALFYTANISITSLTVAASCLPVLMLLNHCNVISKSPYIFVGVIMWVATLKSGVHATLAGVILALFIPLKTGQDSTDSPLKTLEKDLHSLVAFFVLPAFAFANAGINLTGVGLATIFHPVSIGIALGLFVGKQIGIFTLCWIAIKMGVAKLSDGMTWLSLYAISALCGIGFTMSLFIGSLAFEETGVDLLFDERLGIILGSVFSGILGYTLLRITLPKLSE